jgi:hypothetical protein
MHRTLKAEATKPPKADMKGQQREFDRFRREYNEERPHDGLKGKTPGSQYAESSRSYSGKIPVYEYPSHYVVKRVTNGGTFKLRGRLLFLSNPLKQQLIGLEEIEDGLWSIYFCNVLIGRISERDFIIRG